MVKTSTGTTRAGQGRFSFAATRRSFTCARHTLIVAALAAAMAGTAAHAAQVAAIKQVATTKTKKAPRPNRNAPIELFAVNTKETLQLRLRDDKGRPMRGVQKRFDTLMRCHYTKKQHAMNPRLVRMLFQIGKHYPGRRIEIVSGYRHPSVAKNPRSPHMQGLACDFRVVGVKNTDLRDYLRTGYEKVGVGYYPNSAFVHLDVRKDRSVFWIDYSGPGERAIYSENAAGDLKSGRAETYKPIKIDSSWVTLPEEVGDDAKPPAVRGPQGTPDDVNNPRADSVEPERAPPAPRGGAVEPTAQ